MPPFVAVPTLVGHHHRASVRLLTIVCCCIGHRCKSKKIKCYFSEGSVQRLVEPGQDAHIAVLNC